MRPKKGSETWIYYRWVFKLQILIFPLSSSSHMLLVLVAGRGRGKGTNNMCAYHHPDHCAYMSNLLLFWWLFIFLEFDPANIYARRTAACVDFSWSAHVSEVVPRSICKIKPLEPSFSYRPLPCRLVQKGCNLFPKKNDQCKRSVSGSTPTVKCGKEMGEGISGTRRWSYTVVTLRSP